jgi:hypothetical protein
MTMEAVPDQAEKREAIVRGPSRQRSRVTNGTGLFVDAGDGRGPWARRLRDVIDLHLADLGGADVVSEAEASIVRRAATLTIELERLEAKFSTGQAPPGDLDLYQRTANSLRRLLEAVGLKRVARDVTPPDANLYLARHEEAQPE